MHKITKLVVVPAEEQSFWNIDVCLAMSIHDSTNQLYQVVACRDSVSQGPCLTLLSGSRAAAR